MKRILIIADDPTLNTGYARVGRFLATALHNSGEYRVRYLPCNACTANTDRNKFGFELESFDVGDRYNGNRLSPTLISFKPSLVIVLGEFAFVGYIGNVCRQMGVRSMYYMPVEGAKYPPRVVHVAGGFIDYHLTLQKFHYIVAYSQFGADNINRLLPGIVTDIVPHQVDIETFRPLDRETIFKTFFPNLCESPGINNAFIVGHVGRNQRRKGMDYVLQGFAHFLKNHVNEDRCKAYLFLTTDPKDPQGFHLFDMIDDLSLRGHVIFNQVVGGKQGPLDNQLCEIYNTFDVHLCPHRAEGFGLPVLESMACGVRTITTNYATPPEFGKGVVDLIEPAWFEPVVATNCDWAVVNPAHIGDALGRAYEDFKGIHTIDIKARERAEHYSEERVATKWLRLLKELQLPELTSTIEEGKVGQSDTDTIMDNYLEELN